MYLKALEIQGFKSFADKTRLTFEKNVTAIVGPNGSGKSNLSDAILWVMGEQRTKALRGSRMEDVIFGGTEKRSKLGFAQVSLIIDNSGHVFESPEPEITITRRYYRSGDSEYYINKDQVRLKDINELLMDTGLGRDGYSIIGQGRIAEIISSHSTDRREVFEEAAGISRFRYRKEEAERRLEKTEENLLRINDKVDELELQVGPLKKQSETAKRYLVLHDELRVREVSLWMASLDRIHAQADAIAQEYDQAVRELEKAKNEIAALYASTESITERMNRKNIQTDEARERQTQAEQKLAGMRSAQAVLQTEIQGKKDRAQSMRNDLLNQDQRVAELRNSIRSNDDRLAELTNRRNELNGKLDSSRNVMEGCRMKLQSRKTALEELTEKVNALEVEGRTMESRIRLLTGMEKDFEGYSNAVRTVMRESERGTISGIFGPVTNLIRTDGDCALAIETALGASGQHIVVQNQNVGKTAIEFLKRKEAGRATFIPLDIARGGVLRNPPESDPGFVGIASELVRCENRFTPVIENLLGRTVVAESLSDAVRMSRNSSYSLRIVTLDGQLIQSGGSMTGGSAQKGSGILSRASELEQLKKKQTRLAEDEKAARTQLNNARVSLAAVQLKMDDATREQNELNADGARVDAETRTLHNTQTQLQALLDGLTGSSQLMQQQIDGFLAEAGELLKTMEQGTAEIQAQSEEVERIKAEIAGLVQDRLELETKRTRAEKETQQRHEAVSSLDRVVMRIEQKKASSELEEKQLIDRLWDNYELSHTAASAVRRPVENLQKANREISELKKSINALGPPNLGAIEEYERVNTRYEFLTSQRADVEKARKELLGIINDITDEMKTIFTGRFREIDSSFRTTFLELFGGGKAELRLEDEDNVLECGIEIRCQPPGKALSNINLLSGGEKAFVAIALYFAILKVRPTPFCVMDEIEAALDEANVTRFAEYLRRLADKTQFLVITHRRGTMEEAEMLYGVTMQERGVSSVLALDVDSVGKNMVED